jgi:8-oxo-dGTP pyrophosphatase MutT (NUDIX family)
MSDVWKPSVTVAAIVERDGQFLLVEEDTPDGVRINQPAGHLEAGESLLHAVVRETLEETAWHFEPQGLLGCYMTRSRSRSPDGTRDATYLRFAFVGGVSSHDAGRALDPDIRRAFWAGPDEIRQRAAEHRSPLLARCLDDYLAQRAAGRGWIALDAIYTDPSVIAPSVIVP